MLRQTVVHDHVEAVQEGRSFNDRLVVGIIKTLQRKRKVPFRKLKRETSEKRKTKGKRKISSKRTLNKSLQHENPADGNGSSSIWSYAAGVQLMIKYSPSLSSQHEQISPSYTSLKQ